MKRDELLPIIEAMRQYGGSFVQHLAIAMLHADSDNLRRLTDAFADLIASYKKNFVDKK
jgi:hypothetical protein